MSIGCTYNNFGGRVQGSSARSLAPLEGGGALGSGQVPGAPLSRLLHTELHWLDVPERVVYKLGCLHGQAPVYLVELCQPVAGVLSHHGNISDPPPDSSWSHRTTGSATNGRRAFCVASPSVWNSLPDSFRGSVIGGNSFRQSLKTFLFATY